MRKSYLFLLLISLTMGYLATAQVTTGSISGSVKTNTNEPLAGATVEATHQPSGTQYSTVSASSGQFNLQNLKPGGPYLVKITFVGYKPSTYEEIYIKLGEPYVLNSQLGDTESTLAEVVITTAARNPILNANRTGAITNIGSRQIQAMPTITRSMNDLIRLTPQASSSSTGAIGGGNYRQNYITVDGSDFNNTFGIGTNLPANGSPISIDALDEISINVTPFDIKQSGFIGSAINAVTRSGTNKFSGSVYTFWRNENQQGNEVAYNTPFPVQNLDVKTYGFRLGGPIIKNKLFFFINGEKGKTIQPGQLNVASSASAPFGSSPNINKPSETFLNSVSDYLRNEYGYETGPYQGYDNESENTRFVARVDWNISNKHKLNVRYSQVESSSPSFVSTSRTPLAGYASTAGRQSNTALWFKNTNYYQEANFYSLSAELNSNFGKVSNTLRATFTQQNDPRSSDSEIFPFVDILDSAGGAPGVPLVSFGYEPFTFGNLRDVRTTSFVDYITWTAGKHNWTLGGQIDVSTTKNGFQRFGTSYYTFRSWGDFVNGVKPVDFSLTYPLNENFEQAFPRFKLAQYSVYGQDEIALSSKFRLTIGLRLDLPSYLDVAEIKTHPLVDSLTFENGEKINTGVLPETKILWSPRVGFNWDVKGDRSVQIRGGTGIFTGKVPTVWIVSQSGDAGLLQFTQTFETPTANRNNPALYVTPGPFNPDPGAYRPSTLPKVGGAIPSSVSAIDPNFQFPQTWKSSLAVDVKLPWGMVGTLEGIVNKDLNVALGRNPNLLPSKDLNVAGYPDTRPIYGSTVPTRFINTLNAAGYPTTGGTSAFNPVILDNKKDGYYWSLTARVDKQFSKGFSGSIAYTHSQSKILYDGSGDQLLNTWSLTQIVRDPNNPELGFANFNVPNRIVAAFTYRKEYLKHLATSISVFFEGSSAGRFSYTYSADFNRDGQTNDLIYVPRHPSEITFTDFNYGTTAAPNLYTAKQQSDIFFRYIEQDPYLSKAKGHHAERNGAKLPWRNQMDVKLAQEIFTGIGSSKNTLQFTVDIFNFGNMINKNWGIYKTVNASAILVPTNVSSLVAGGTVRPTFRLATDRNQPVSTTYRENNSLTSTYYMQFGLRYLFN